MIYMQNNQKHKSIKNYIETNIHRLWIQFRVMSGILFLWHWIILKRKIMHYVMKIKIRIKNYKTEAAPI